MARFFKTLLFFFLIGNAVQAQDKQSVQVKTFDPSLQVLKNVTLSINDNEFIKIGEKGVAVVELNTTDLPVKSITVQDEKLEAASWNFSKGVLEIIIRPKSYTIRPFLLQLADGQVAPPSDITFYGVKTVTVTSDQKGEFRLPISLQDKITSPSQFLVPGFRVVKIDQKGRSSLLIVERPKPAVASKMSVEPIVAENENFDVGALDSIKSLSMFYAVFKNVFISDLDADVRKRVDAKFNRLIAQLQDSLSSTPSFMGTISDSSFVNEDIRSLIDDATLKRDKLKADREDFQVKIDLIASKLEKGAYDERNNLLSDLELLEQLVIANKGAFNQNQNDYSNMINALKEKYFDIQNLETRLSENERQRLEEQRVFRLRLLAIGGVVILFGILIVILATFSNRLRKQSKDLKAANEEINTINENLEKIVIKRTELLENSNKELDIFLYRASHDLRSPIRSILGLCNIHEHIPQEEYIKLITDTTRNMDTMLKKLTSISEISRESLNRVPVDMAHHIESVVSSYSSSIAKADIQFHVSIPENITCQSSNALMDNILIGLLENAIFFSSLKHSEHRRVEVSVTKTDTKIELVVFDNGIGMAQDVQAKIFNMFYKGNELAKGNGLGLYMVKKSTEALRGKVKVESEEGQYSKFTILLPLQ